MQGPKWSVQLLSCPNLQKTKKHCLLLAAESRDAMGDYIGFGGGPCKGNATNLVRGSCRVSKNGAPRKRIIVYFGPGIRIIAYLNRFWGPPLMETAL